VITKNTIYDVIVCGAGHAGVEACLAASRMGASTLLLTGNIDTIAQMSCNPAIGGQAKGHLVREIDALGGEMAINTDLTAIQFRLLNASKGPAVQSPRAQCDKKAYQYRMKHTLEIQPNLKIFQTLVTSLIFTKSGVVGCSTNLGAMFYGKTVIITTGTFLRGLMHVGEKKHEGGRLGDFSSTGLSNSLLSAGIELQRLKTGTPPRIRGCTINFSSMIEQRGDDNPCLFAFHDTRVAGDTFHVEHPREHRLGWRPGSKQASCWLTYTTPKSEKIVRENLYKSAMYSGEISGIGPRYCPSIEDKFVRFSDKERHLLYIEPEGISTNEYYINGLSTSLPLDVQIELVHSIPGLETADILRPAYAVEYDFAPPTQLYPSLESKKIEGLFFAGQINGTSGYEEAAAQGVIAGINAVQKARGLSPLVLQRHEAYIGVLIDDLVTKGTLEPYRMFTSRAEHRLVLNHGSAELRLLKHAEYHKLLSYNRIKNISAKLEAIETWERRLDGKFALSTAPRELLINGAPASGSLPGEFLAQSKEVKDEVAYRIIYRGYLQRELKMIEKLQASEAVRLSADIDYLGIRGLRKESAQKLQQLRPQNLGQAGRISGVNPSDISILMVWLHARSSAQKSPAPAPDEVPLDPIP
jgi:tRNA uridine 5-carboxymethylaminomethyl modification enzyme